MESAPVQMVINIFAAVGFTLTGSIIKGLIEYGGWLFFVLAVFGVFHTIFISIEERDAILHVIKKFASIFVALLLFYFPVQVAINDVVAGSTGTTIKKSVQGNSILSSMTNFSTSSLGLVNGITYLAYQISSGLPALAQEIAGSSGKDLWPGVESAIDTDLSSAMQSNDPQIAANIAQWKFVLAPAILKSDPKLATALESNSQLGYVFANPYSTSSETDPQYGADAATVKALLKTDPPTPSFPEIVNQQQSELADVAAKYGSVVPFSAGTSSSTSSSSSNTPTYVNVKLFSKKYWKLNQDVSAYDKIHNAVTPVTSWTSEAYAWLPNLVDKVVASKKTYKTIRAEEEGNPSEAIASDLGVDVEDFFGGKKENDPTQKFTSLSDLYQNLGRSVLVASVAGYARNPKNIAAMQAMCKTHGDEACAQTLQMFSNQIRRPKDVVGHTPGVSSWLGQTLADLGSFTITGLIEVVVYSIGTLFNTASPYIIGLSMTAAILVSLIGPFWMLIAGRFVHALEWMTLPVILVNLWDALYTIWLIVCAGLDGIIPHLSNAVNGYGSSSLSAPRIGIVSNPDLMNHIVNIFEAMGFLAIPTVAYMLLFGKAGDGMRSNFGTSMGRMIGMTATMAAMAAMRAGRKSGGKAKPGGKVTAPGGNTPSGSGGLTPSNPVKGGPGAPGALSNAPKASGGKPLGANSLNQNIGSGSASTASNSASTSSNSSASSSNSGSSTSNTTGGNSSVSSTSNSSNNATKTGSTTNTQSPSVQNASGQGAGPSSGRQGSGPGAVRQGQAPTSGGQGSGPASSRQGSGPSSGRQGSGPGVVRQGQAPTSGGQGSGPASTRQGSGPSSSRQGTGPVASSQQASKTQVVVKQKSAKGASSTTQSQTNAGNKQSGPYRQNNPTGLFSPPPKTSR